MGDSTTTKAGSDAGPAFVVPGPLRDGIRLWLIRHGETEWSRDGKHTGRTDVPLTDAGRPQAERMPALPGDLSGAYVRCSPLTRARETARLAGLTVDDVDPDLAEWDYGDYEGRTSADIRRERPDWQLWRDGAPGGETPAEVAARADRVLTGA